MRINARREYPLQPSPSWLFHTWSTNVAASVALAKTGRRYTFYTCYSSLSIHHRRGAPHTATHQISSNIADSDDISPNPFEIRPFLLLRVVPSSLRVVLLLA
ncbi:hypothetical protein, partial [Bifidobacterium pseudolongum]|uniref:hypothetical protein n=1 Tax=Bifidobacterium pseudolongum TaxID=1694 RepID=UPI001A9248A3